MTALVGANRIVHLNKLPDLKDKTYLVTGGNVGLGYEVAKALAAKQAHVFMTARNDAKQRAYVTAQSWVFLFQQ